MTLKEIQKWFRREKWQETADGGFQREGVRVEFVPDCRFVFPETIKAVEAGELNVEPEMGIKLISKSDGVELLGGLSNTEEDKLRLTGIGNSEFCIFSEEFIKNWEGAYEGLLLYVPGYWKTRSKPRQYKSKLTIVKILKSAGWEQSIFKGILKRETIFAGKQFSINEEKLLCMSFVHRFGFGMSPIGVGPFTTRRNESGDILTPGVTIYGFDRWQKEKEVNQ